MRGDLDRSFLADLVTSQPDYLIIDFNADVHYGVLRLPDGRFGTDNPVRRKIRDTDWYRPAKADPQR